MSREFAFGFCFYVEAMRASISRRARNERTRKWQTRIGDETKLGIRQY
jgi:hypothetical protein